MRRSRRRRYCCHDSDDGQLVQAATLTYQQFWFPQQQKTNIRPTRGVSSDKVDFL